MFAAAFASYWSRPARWYRGRKSRADTTREHACPWAFTRWPPTVPPRRHWRNHLSMSAPHADIPRRKWSLAGGIDDHRSARSAVYRRFYARARAYRVIEAAIYDAEGVCFLTWQRWHGRCSISLLFLRLDEELSKRAQQLVMFIAGKRAAREVLPLRFSRDSYASPWKLRNISLLSLTHRASFIFFPTRVDY